MDEIVKLPITYRMTKANCTAETYIELPVTKEIYDSLVKEMTRYGFSLDSKGASGLVRTALKKICRLQGYELSAVIINIKTE